MAPSISVGVPPVSQELWSLGLGKSDGHLKTDLKDETQLYRKTVYQIVK